MKNLILFALCFTLSGCDFSCSKKTQEPFKANYDENYAYDMILQYEKFGPKVPGTDAHKQAGDWLVGELKRLGTKVEEQVTTATTFDQKTIPVRNIIAQINPDASTRYLFSAHWDNRPFADEDKEAPYQKKPIPGVNDGGSGVVILLGIAKAVQGMDLPFGIDLAFWDAEDWGTPHNEESYCLGTQYWVKHTIPSNYHPKFGINYDMVGRLGSVFPVESYSAKYAPQVIEGIREAARKLGYQDYFPYYAIGPIVDDHYFVREGLGVPMVDLIYMTKEGTFPPEWHTHLDTSEYISREVLKVVGQTTLELLSEQK